MSSPDKISFSKSYKENLSEKVFLTLKDMEMVMYLTNKIIEFKTENIKGFQYQEIVEGRVSYNIDFYNDKGDMYIMLIHRKKMKQSDMDYILSSIKID
ncbi:hypothetical protein [Acetivibrio cellulolyticus]|uniref:hypothetical protein n=1 Tax=Acetivibrio cellulolyticus TaxID=35830 RepID=UPI0013C35AB7|nr:hypothetical protein [Acetivibrio cellulolyticus]